MTNTVAYANPNAVLFANIAAHTEAAMKALGTTITNGATLLHDGYTFERDRHAANAYRCLSPKGETYNLQWNATEISCDCGAACWLGVCKHAIALSLHREMIDLEAEAPAPRTPVAFDPSDWK